MVQETAMTSGATHIQWDDDLESKLSELVLAEMFDFDAVALAVAPAVCASAGNLGVSPDAVTAAVVKAQYAIITKRAKNELNQLKKSTIATSSEAPATTRVSTPRTPATSHVAAVPGSSGLLDALSPGGREGQGTPKGDTPRSRRSSSKKKKRTPFVLSDGDLAKGEGMAGADEPPAITATVSRVPATDAVRSRQDRQHHSSAKSKNTHNTTRRGREERVYTKEALPIDFGSLDNVEPVSLVSEDEDPTLGFDLSHVIDRQVRSGGDAEGKDKKKNKKKKGKKKKGQNLDTNQPSSSQSTTTTTTTTTTNVTRTTTTASKKINNSNAIATSATVTRNNVAGDEDAVYAHDLLHQSDPTPSGYSIFEGPSLKAKISSIYSDVRERLPTIAASSSAGGGPDSDDSDSELSLDEHGMPKIVMSKHWDAEPAEDPFEAMDRIVRGEVFTYDPAIIGGKLDDNDNSSSNSHPNAVPRTPGPGVSSGIPASETVDSNRVGEASESLSASEWSPTGSSSSAIARVDESTMVQEMVTQSFHSAQLGKGEDSRKGNDDDDDDDDDCKGIVDGYTKVSPHTSTHNQRNHATTTTTSGTVTSTTEGTGVPQSFEDIMAVAAAQAVAAAAQDSAQGMYDDQALAELERDFLAAVRHGFSGDARSIQPVRQAPRSGPILKMSDALNDIDLDRLLAAVEAGTVHGTLNMNGEEIDDPLHLDGQPSTVPAPISGAGASSSSSRRPHTAHPSTRPAASPTRTSGSEFKYREQQGNTTRVSVERTSPQRSAPHQRGRGGNTGTRPGTAPGPRGFDPRASRREMRVPVSRAEMHDSSESEEEVVDWREERRRLKEQLAASSRK